jgi:acetylornithine deacetylase
LLLNAHMDTVGVAGMARPFEARIDGDRLYGRGAYDMKGGLAAIMLAARAVKQADWSGGELILTAVMDEEHSSLGTEAVVASLQVDAAIVTEPTALRVCAAHKGFAWISVQTTGQAAHGSKPDLGVDAIAHMGRVLVSLESLAIALAQRPRHGLLGTGSIHASLIEGGQELSSYPEYCRLQVERRTIPGETRHSVLSEIEDILSAHSRQDPRFSGQADLMFWRDPFEVSRQEPIVQVVQRAAREVLDEEPDIYGDTPWMDAALLSEAGIPTVVFGPGGSGAHATTEYGVLSDVSKCAEVLAQVAMTFCSGQA